MIKIGVSGILCRNRKVLLGKRLQNDVAGGQWCTPGGGIEFGEEIDHALVREFKEETGLSIRLTNPRSFRIPFIHVCESIVDGKHVVLVFKEVFDNDESDIPTVGDGFDQVTWFDAATIWAADTTVTGLITPMTSEALRHWTNH